MPPRTVSSDWDDDEVVVVLVLCSVEVRRRRGSGEVRPRFLGFEVGRGTEEVAPEGGAASEVEGEPVIDDDDDMMRPCRNDPQKARDVAKEVTNGVNETIRGQ